MQLGENKNMGKVINVKLGEKLKTIRTQKGLSQQDVADRLGLTRSAIGFYETGKRTVDIETLFKICDIYNVDVNEVLKDIRKYAYKG